MTVDELYNRFISSHLDSEITFFYFQSTYNKHKSMTILILSKKSNFCRKEIEQQKIFIFLRKILVDQNFFWGTTLC